MHLCCSHQLLTHKQLGSYLHSRGRSLGLVPHTVIHPTGCSQHPTERMLCPALAVVVTPWCSFWQWQAWHCLLLFLLQGFSALLQIFALLLYFFKLTHSLLKNLFEFLRFNLIGGHLPFQHDQFRANTRLDCFECPIETYGAHSGSCLSSCGCPGSFAKDAVSIPHVPEGQWLSE